MNCASNSEVKGSMSPRWLMWHTVCRKLSRCTLRDSGFLHRAGEPHPNFLLPTRSSWLVRAADTYSFLGTCLVSWSSELCRADAGG